MATFVSMATCHSCNKTSRYSGVSRDYFLKNPNTCGSSIKRKTPQSASRANMAAPQSASRANMAVPRSASKDKTPCSTPRSTPTGTPTSTPSSGSSTKHRTRLKSWFVQRLSKILVREDKKEGKKGDWKDFLSSL